MLERYQRHLFYYRKKNGEPLSFRSQHARLVPLRVWFYAATHPGAMLEKPVAPVAAPERPGAEDLFASLNAEAEEDREDGG